MIIVGFEASAPSTGKRYTAVATSTGHFMYWHGPRRAPTSQGGSKQVADFQAATAMLQQKYSEKVHHGEYVNDRVAHTDAVDYDGTNREEVLQAFTDATDSFGSLDNAVVQATLTAAAQAPAQQPTRRRRPSATRSQQPGLQLVPGEVFTRPNGDVYMPRLIAGQPDVALLRHFRSLHRPLHTLLVGLAGTGKTAVVEAAFGSDLVSILGHGDMTEGHLVGKLMPTIGGGWAAVPGPLTVAMENGWPLLIDEINKLPSDLISILHAATDGRGTARFEDRADQPVVHAKPGFIVIGTLNPDSLGSTGLPEAITSRFGVQVTVTTDWDAARQLGVHDDLVTIGENLNTKNLRNEHGRTVWVPQMRELLHAKQLIDAGLPILFAASAMLAQCPYPEDVPVVAQVMRDVLGDDIAPLTTGAQVVLP